LPSTVEDEFKEFQYYVHFERISFRCEDFRKSTDRGFHKDKLTTEARFKACKMIINEYHPEIEVIGVFWARTI